MTNIRIMLAGNSAKAKTILSMQEDVLLVADLDSAEFILQDADTYRSERDVQQDPAVQKVAPSTLTRRELEVLRLTAEGNSVRQVAAMLDLSAKTVDAHKVNLMRKLHIHNKAHLVQYAFRNRILTLDLPPAKNAVEQPLVSHC